MRVTGHHIEGGGGVWGRMCVVACADRAAAPSKIYHMVASECSSNYGPNKKYQSERVQRNVVVHWGWGAKLYTLKKPFYVSGFWDVS